MVTQNRFVAIMLKVVLTVLFILPLGISISMQVHFMASTFKAYELLMLLPMVVVFFLVMWYLSALNEELPHQRWLELGLVIAICIVIRLAMMLILSTNPASDFLDSHLLAMDILKGNGHDKLPAYTWTSYTSYVDITALTLALVYKVLGADVKIAKLIMVLFSGLTSGLLYLTAKDLTKKRSVGIAAAFIYSFQPVMIAYTGVISPEHLSIFFLTLVSYIYAQFIKQESKSFRNLSGYSLLGISLGLADWYRPIGSIALLAILIIEILDLIGKWKDKPSRLPAGVSLAIFLSSYLLVSWMGVWIPEKVLDVDLLNPNQGIASKLYVGLNPQSDGRLTWGDEGVIKTAYEKYHRNYDLANQEIMSLTRQRLFDHFDEVPNMLIVKLQRIWESNDEIFFWASLGSNDYELLYYLSIIDSCYFTIIMLLAAVSTFFYIFKTAELSKSILLMQLFVLGFAMLLEITEVQVRYRILLMPYLAVLAALGLHWISSLKITALQAGYKHPASQLSHQDTSI